MSAKKETPTKSPNKSTLVENNFNNSNFVYELDGDNILVTPKIGHNSGSSYNVQFHAKNEHVDILYPAKAATIKISEDDIPRDVFERIAKGFPDAYNAAKLKKMNSELEGRKIVSDTENIIALNKKKELEEEKRKLEEELKEAKEKGEEAREILKKAKEDLKRVEEASAITNKEVDEKYKKAVKEAKKIEKAANNRIMEAVEEARKAEEMASELVGKANAERLEAVTQLSHIPARTLVTLGEIKGLTGDNTQMIEQLKNQNEIMEIKKSFSDPLHYRLVMKKLNAKGEVTDDEIADFYLNIKDVKNDINQLVEDGIDKATAIGKYRAQLRNKLIKLSRDMLNTYDNLKGKVKRDVYTNLRPIDKKRLVKSLKYGGSDDGIKFKIKVIK